MLVDILEAKLKLTNEKESEKQKRRKNLFPQHPSKTFVGLLLKNLTHIQTHTWLA